MSGLTISTVVEKVHIVAGIGLNLLLLYVIRRHTRLSLGVYKHLLTVFASFDLFLTILHGFVEPRVVIVGKTFGVVAHSFIKDRKLTALYCSCFTIPFILMNIHFLFRYWTIQKQHLIHLFSRPDFIAFLVIFILTQVVFLSSLCFQSDGDSSTVGLELLRSTYEREYGKIIEKGWLVMDHWRDGVEDPRFTVCLFSFDFIMAVSFSASIWLGALTYNGIRNAQKISNQARRLQFKLLIAVTAQTFIHFIFVYIPYALNLNLPYFDLPVGPMADMCMILTACFPAWDAVIIILLMTDYREAVWAMIRAWKTTTSVAPSRFEVSEITSSVTTASPASTVFGLDCIDLNGISLLYGSFVAGVGLNTLLLYLIRRHTRLSLGIYKHLLTVFASFDLFLIILHGIVEPRVLIVDKTFGVVADSVIKDRKLTSLYCACFTIPFALMNIHFIFRYWIIKEHDRIHLFSRPAFIFFLVIIVLTQLCILALLSYITNGEGNDAGTELLKSTYNREYGKRIEDGWLVMDHWREDREDPRFALSLGSYDIVMAVSFSASRVLGAKTFNGIRNAQKISTQARKLQFKLLIAVTAQTFVPFIFVYIPYALVLNLPFFGLPSGPMAEMCMILTACFPAWDAVMIILLMTDYREAVLSMMRVTRWGKTQALAPSKFEVSGMPTTTTSKSLVVII